MDVNANPHAGSDVASAAQAIERSGLLEQESLPPEEGATEPAPATRKEPKRTSGQEAETARSAADNEAEAEAEDVPDPKPEKAEDGTEQDQSADAEADEGTLAELPDSLTDLATAMGLEADGLDNLKVNVKVNGEVRSVTVKDAIRGYQMEADYRQKTADLARERDTFNTAVQRATHEWQNRFATLDTFTQQLEGLITEGSKTLDQLLEEGDTHGYLAAKARQEQRQQALEHARAERAKAQEQAAEQQRQAFADYLKQEQARLAEAIPEMVDKAKGPALKQELKGYLSEVGFSEEEIAGLVDHRQVLVVRDAMRWRALQKGKPAATKKLKGLPKVLKPGAARDKGEVRRDKAAAGLQRLRKSGSIDDAARLIREAYL